MRVSYEWLKDMVDVPEDPKDLVNEYIRTGTEVEASRRLAPTSTTSYTAQVVSKKPASRLRPHVALPVDPLGQERRRERQPRAAADRLRRPELQRGRPHRDRHDRRACCPAT
jgi:hypothetical protein